MSVVSSIYDCMAKGLVGVSSRHECFTLASQWSGVTMLIGYLIQSSNTRPHPQNDPPVYEPVLSRLRYSPRSPKIVICPA